VADEVVVEQTPEQVAAAPAAAAAAKPDPVALAAEVARLTAENKEKDEAARYWHGLVKAGTKEPAKEKPAEAEDDTDLLDLITTKGPKGLKDWIGKQGYVSKDEVDAKVESRAQQVVREAELVGEFPDLRDDKSEFFKETAVEYGNLVKQGVPSGVAMGLAARLVDGRTTAAAGSAAPTKEEKEAARVARIKAQGGDKTRRGAATEGDEALTSEQETVLAGMGLSKADFEASKKELGTAARRRG
jgi:hypothetical protein